MDLTFRDSLSMSERSLTPSPTKPLQFYVCGPTVYAPSHVGHARSYLVFDTVRRFFEVQGFPVRHIQNITDFEDKITRRAEMEGISWEVLSRREARSFFRSMGGLYILTPHAVPASSRYVAMMVSIMRRLERKGFTYRKHGSLYFDASRATGATNFSADLFLSVHAMPEPGTEALTEANDPRDFILWKPTTPPAPCWTSPWGKGMPGWHVECYAMASRYLSLPMDLHGGGLDLIFPHHYAENLISIALKGTPFSKNFLHNSFVTIDSRKMAKSSGQLVTIRDALQTVSPGGLRCYLLCRRYDERLEYSLYEARQADESWKEDQGTLWQLQSPDGPRGYPVERLKKGLDHLLTAISRDLGTPGALRVMHDVASDIRRHGASGLKAGDLSKGREILSAYEKLLGLPLLRPPVGRARQRAH